MSTSPPAKRVVSKLAGERRNKGRFVLAGQLGQNGKARVPFNQGRDSIVGKPGGRHGLPPACHSRNLLLGANVVQVVGPSAAEIHVEVLDDACIGWGGAAAIGCTGQACQVDFHRGGSAAV
jgi:hypothetical protein